MNTQDNKLNKIFSKITPKKQLEIEDIVYGEITKVTDKTLFVDLRYNKDGKVFSPSDTGILFIKNISKDYLENIRDAFNLGDLIKARVVDKTKFGFMLETTTKDLGVIKANCIYCKQPLDLKFEKNGEIKCKFCKKNQKRKVAKE